MIERDYVAFAGLALGFILGWGLHSIALAIAYRLGIVRWVGIGASTGGGNG